MGGFDGPQPFELGIGQADVSRFVAVPGGAARVGHAPGALLLSPYLSVDSKFTSVQKTGQLTPVDRSIDAQHPSSIQTVSRSAGLP
jgi:hypothetical protein